MIDIVWWVAAINSRLALSLGTNGPLCCSGNGSLTTAALGTAPNHGQGIVRLYVSPEGLTAKPLRRLSQRTR